MSKVKVESRWEIFRPFIVRQHLTLDAIDSVLAIARHLLFPVHTSSPGIPPPPPLLGVWINLSHSIPPLIAGHWYKSDGRYRYFSAH